MYKLLAIGSTSNYFFAEAVKAFSFQHNVILNDLRSAEDVDFIFCVNDIRPVLKNAKCPIITWIGERPSYIYLRDFFHLKQADLIFMTERKFIDNVKAVVGHNNVFYLPLGTGFGRKEIPINYINALSFVGNTMQKQIKSIETPKEMIYKLPLRVEDYNITKRFILEENTEDSLMDIERIFHNSHVLNLYKNKLKKNSQFKEDVYLGYIGMLLTYKRRKYVLNELIKEYPQMTLMPREWNDEVNGGDVQNKIIYNNIDVWYSSCKININISSMHMPTALNSRVFDIPFSGGMLLTDYREGIEELFSKDEIVTYKCIDELKDYIKFFASNDAERNRIIRNAADKIEKEHRYFNRIEYILKMYNAL